jgi:hypothetical protein
MADDEDTLRILISTDNHLVSRISSSLFSFISEALTDNLITLDAGRLGKG